MKPRLFLLVLVALLGCHSTPPRSAALSASEAGSRAQRLANEKCQAVYTCQPFHDAKAGRLVANSWVWHTVQGKGTADYEANVKFALDGTNPEVSVTQLYSNPR